MVVVVDTLCPDCGAPSTSRWAARPRLCGECATARRRAVTAAYRESHREELRAYGLRDVVRELTCETCGEDFVREAGIGPIPKWCEGCRRTRGVEVQRRLRGQTPYETRSCRECGAHLGVWKRRFCDDCCEAHDRLRKTLRRGVEYGELAESIQPREIFERDRWICGICGQRVLLKKRDRNDLMSPLLDHIVPISRGGLHVHANVQLAHLGCNLSKGNRAVGDQMRLF